MVNVDDAQIAKLKSHGHEFEILVDANLAIAFRSNETADINAVLAVPTVFSDAKKGEEASPNAMKQALGTDDPIEAAKVILKKGNVPLTTEYKHKIKEQKLKQVINMIHRNAVDPKTHLPHPAERIEAALEEAKFHIDEFEAVSKQVENALKAIRPILPIQFETKEIAVKIPAEFAAKSYQVITKFGKKLREDWQSDGSLMVVIEMPGGLEEDFHNELNALCHGNVETKILKTK